MKSVTRADEQIICCSHPILVDYQLLNLSSPQHHTLRVFSRRFSERPVAGELMCFSNRAVADSKTYCTRTVLGC
jgi:hypothetical protein